MNYQPARLFSWLIFALLLVALPLTARAQDRDGDGLSDLEELNYPPIPFNCMARNCAATGCMLTSMMICYVGHREDAYPQIPDSKDFIFSGR